MSLITLISIFIAHLRNTCRQLFNRHPIPYKWLIQLTNDCNSRCESCDIWKINKSDPTKKQQESSLQDYYKLFKSSGSNLMWLSLSGGEVTLYQNFEEFASLVRAHCPRLKVITFTTNGLNPDRVLELAFKLRPLARDFFIVISLDGDSELHDRLRGVPGNFEKATRSNQLLKSAGFNVYFGATLSNLNQDWVKENVNLIKYISLIHSDGIFNRSNLIDDYRL